MAFAIVKWIDENRYSVVPTTEIVTPSRLIAEELPVNGVCQRDTGRHPATIVRIGDSKLAMQVDLESMIALSNSVAVEMEEAVHSNRSIASSLSVAGKRKVPDFDAKSGSRKRKKHKVADSIFKKPQHSSTSNALPIENLLLPSCAKCKEYKLQLRNLEAKLAVCQSDLEDACLAKAAKFSVIQDLRAQLKQSKSELERKSLLLSKTIEENASLLASTKDNARQGMSVLPVPPPHGIAFLKSLVDFYTVQQMRDDNGSEEDEESVDESEDSEVEIGDTDAYTHDRIHPRYIGEGGIDSAEIQSSSSLHLDEGRNLYLLNGDPQLASASTELDESLAVCESGGYSYKLTAEDIAREQSAFEPGPDKQELVSNLGVYISYLDLKRLELNSKDTSTGLMRSLITIWYSPQRLAASSATRGINERIRMAIFRFCQEKFPGVTSSKLKRDLTNKCGEERRAILKCPLTLP